MYRLSLLVLLLMLSSCGRYFPGALKPMDNQAAGMTVNDDGSITYNRDRLAITLKPMTDAELNRLAATSSDLSVNPYTFGNLTATGDDWTPQRFTVFRLEVGNYQFPKIKIDPLNSRITTANSRKYWSFSYAQLYNYFRAYWLGRTGQGRIKFQHRTDLLKRTLYSDAMVFSGSDEEGFLVFPHLDDDVREIQVHIADIAVRFDYAELPVETLNLSFSFQRDILKGFTPTSAVSHN